MAVVSRPVAAVLDLLSRRRLFEGGYSMGFSNSGEVDETKEAILLGFYKLSRLDLS